MEREFIKTSIPVDRMAKAAKIQTVCEGDIVIPDIKPDVRDVISADAHIVIENEKVTDERVSLNGDIKVNVIYCGDDGSINCVKSSVPFMEFVNDDDLRKGDRVGARYRLTNVKTNVVNDRKINVKALGEIEIKGKMPEKAEIIGEVEGDDSVQVLGEDIDCFYLKAAAKEIFGVEDSFILPGGMKAIDEILRTDVIITDREMSAGDGKVSVRGALLISVLYLGDGNYCEKAEFRIPFGGSSGVDDTKAEDIVWGDIYVNDFNVYAKADDNGDTRVIQAEAEIAADMKVGENRKVRTVRDIYSTKGKTEVKTEAIRFPERGIYKTATDTLREIITIDSAYPDILQIKDVSASADIEDVRINGDMVDVEGVLNIKMLYVTSDDNESLKEVEVMLPFENGIEIRGLYEDTEVDITANVSDVNYSLLSGREAEIRSIVDYSIFALMKNQGEFVTEAVIDENEGVRALPGITIYTIKPGDTLWKIAKRFNTTVEEVLAVNRIENPDVIYPGQRILVLKKV